MTLDRGSSLSPRPLAFAPEQVFLFPAQYRAQLLQRAPHACSMRPPHQPAAGWHRSSTTCTRRPSASCLRTSSSSALACSHSSLPAGRARCSAARWLNSVTGHAPVSCKQSCRHEGALDRPAPRRGWAPGNPLTRENQQTCRPPSPRDGRVSAAVRPRARASPGLRAGVSVLQRLARLLHHGDGAGAPRRAAPARARHESRVGSPRTSNSRACEPTPPATLSKPPATSSTPSCHVIVRA